MVGLVTAEFLSKYRRHAIVVNTLIAAIITPTGDPLNLALMAVPMCLFYEIGIILARILGKKKPVALATTP
jgi:sec-independent protein translocase protein TatC